MVLITMLTTPAHQVNRCGQLQAALAEQKEQTQSILSGWNNHHPAPDHQHYEHYSTTIFSDERAQGVMLTYFLPVMREQHEAEMAQLESLVSSSRGLLRKQNKRFLEQVIRDMVIMRMINSSNYSKVDKLVLADSVIEQLLVDNDRLTDELGRLKENFKVTDI